MVTPFHKKMVTAIPKLALWFYCIPELPENGIEIPKKTPGTKMFSASDAHRLSSVL